MSDQPIINIDTGKEISPETRKMLEQTPEQDMLTEGQEAPQPGSSLRIPVPGIPVSEPKDD